MTRGAHPVVNTTTPRPPVTYSPLSHDTIANEVDRLMNRYDPDRRFHIIFHETLSDVDLRGRHLLDAGFRTGHLAATAVARGAGGRLGPLFVSSGLRGEKRGPDPN